MFRSAALVLAALVLGQSGFALLFAESPRSAAENHRSWDRRYLNPMGLAISADGKRAYVALSGANLLATVDLQSAEIIHRRQTGSHPQEVFRRDDTLYVADDQAEYLVIDLNTETAAREEPSHLPDGAVRRRAAVPVLLDKGGGNAGSAPGRRTRLEERAGWRRFWRGLPKSTPGDGSL
jgi:DNA-binding beta-propeller fold protein YncE